MITAITAETANERVKNHDFDRMEKDLRRDLERCETRLEFKIDSLSLQVLGLEKRMDGMDKRMYGFDKRMDGFDHRLGSLILAFKWGLGMVMTYMTLLMTVFQFLKH